MVLSSSGKEGYRSFSVVNVLKKNGCESKFNAGRYISKTPLGAAKKAFNELCRVKDIRGLCSFYVTVKETTLNSKNKEFMYKLNRNKLDEPVVLLAGKPGEYKVEYSISAKSVSKDEVVKCKKSEKTSGPMKKRTAKKL